VFKWPASHLASTCGIPISSADKIVAARDLKLGAAHRSSAEIKCAKDVLSHLPRDFANWETETVLALALSNTSRVQAVLIVAQGGCSSAALVPRDVFTPLVRFRAAIFVLVHNHPSGDSTPSEADVRLTNRLAAAGCVLGIDMLDHIIVASGGCTSLLEVGLLPTSEELARAEEELVTRAVK
jgi:DNA repair protein RadC